MLTLDQLLHTAQVERYDVSSGAHGAPGVLRCYAETRQVLLERQAAEDLGVEVGLEGTLWTNDTDITAGSRITLAGQGGYAGAITRYADGHGLDHLEVELTPNRPVGTLRTATVSLVDPAATTSTWDPVAEQTRVEAATPYAEVPASISEAAASGRVDVADEVLRVAPYLVTLHRDAEVAAGHLVLVVVDPGDQLLAGRQLRVEHVVLGSHRIERQLLCSIAG